MKRNRTIRSVLTRGASAVALAGVMLAPLAVASPADAAVVRPDSCSGSGYPVTSGVWSGDLQVVMYYNSGCRSVRAVLTNYLQNAGWEIWVYNADTGATAKAYNPSNATGWLNDAGTVSHACVQQSGYAKACTSYY
jgi:hypothetical protein